MNEAVIVPALSPEEEAALASLYENDPVQAQARRQAQEEEKPGIPGAAIVLGAAAALIFFS